MRSHSEAPGVRAFFPLSSPKAQEGQQPPQVNAPKRKQAGTGKEWIWRETFWPELEKNPAGTETTPGSSSSSALCSNKEHNCSDMNTGEIETSGKAES